MQANGAKAQAASAAPLEGAERGGGNAGGDPPRTTRNNAEAQRISKGHARGRAALEKLYRLRRGKTHHSLCSNAELVGESTHKTIWSFAFKFDMDGDTFYACHWDVEKCRSDQYIQPLWNPERGCVEGTEYNDHLLHLEKATAVLNALTDPLKYVLRIIETDLTEAEIHAHKNPKHVYHVYQEGKDSEEMLQRAMLPFQSDQNANMMQSIDVIRRCVAKGGNLKRLFSVLYRSERDVDKPAWDGRPRKAKRLSSTGAVSKEIRTACNPRAPVCKVCKHKHHQGTACPTCGHVGMTLRPVECTLKLELPSPSPYCLPVSPTAALAAEAGAKAAAAEPLTATGGGRDGAGGGAGGHSTRSSSLISPLSPLGGSPLSSSPGAAARFSPPGAKITITKSTPARGGTALAHR